MIHKAAIFLFIFLNNLNSSLKSFGTIPIVIPTRKIKICLFHLLFLFFPSSFYKMLNFIIYHVRKNTHILCGLLLAVASVIHDYYNLNGLLLVTFMRINQELTRFIKYKPNLGTDVFMSKVAESSAAYIKKIKIK